MSEKGENRPLRLKLAQTLFLWFLPRGWGGKGLLSTEQPDTVELLVVEALGQLRHRYSECVGGN